MPMVKTSDIFSGIAWCYGDNDFIIYDHLISLHVQMYM